jgi:predicted Rossmann fold flavoprotein
MCASEAGRRGRRVLVLEHNSEPGRKILISGGGRCNFTNVQVTAANFLSRNPHFAKSALARYTPADFVSEVRRRGIAYHEKKLGQLFCDGSARQILDLLMTRCQETAAVEIRLGVKIAGIERGAGYQVETPAGTFRSNSLVIATGGLSIPKIGASDFGYRIARQFGLKIVPPEPALVPFVLNANDRARWCDLAGVSAGVTARAGDGEFEDKVLITHRGLSGPAALQISSYWQGGGECQFDFTEPIPKRLEQRLAGERQLTVIPEGTEGFAKAEVTRGGVDTAGLSSQTMEARAVPGLYFIGEVVDVTGWLGGYNFQWAWASAVAAGRAC